MPAAPSESPDTGPETISDRIRQRGAGFALALGLEILLILAVLTLGTPMITGDPAGQSTLTSIDFAPAQTEAPPAPEEVEDVQAADSAAEPEPAPKPEPRPEPVRKAEPAPPAPVVPTKTQAPAVEPPARTPPRRDEPVSGPMLGPQRPNTTPDSKRVAGSGPNGEPLYAAAWYREPRPDELRGYLSTASGPGWGLIACRTAPDYRVEDCFAIDEYPTNSHINRSILAAAWQFQVRPPRIGGRSMVGEWVRIRIDYNY